jgi:hypothetical protein
MFHFLCALQCQNDLARWRLLGLLDERPDDHHTLLLRSDVERTCNAGFALQPDLVPTRKPVRADPLRFSTLSNSLNQ